MKVRFVSVFIQTDLIHGLIDCLMILLKSRYMWGFHLGVDM